jgi:hypothetical protein
MLFSASSVSLCLRLVAADKLRCASSFSFIGGL